MAKNRHKVEFQLDTKGIKDLSAAEIKALYMGFTSNISLRI